MVCTFVTMQTRKTEQGCLDVMNRYCKTMFLKRKIEVEHNSLYEYGYMEMDRQRFEVLILWPIIGSNKSKIERVYFIYSAQL